MTAETKTRYRTIIELVALVAVSAIGGLLVAWLKTTYGVSPYWFVGTVTILSMFTTGLVILSLDKLRKPIFVFDWVVAFEGLMGLVLLSTFGAVALAALVWRGITLLLITVALFGTALAVIIYFLKHPPPTTWDDDADL